MVFPVFGGDLLSDILGLILKSSDLYLRTSRAISVDNGKVRIMGHEINNFYVIAIGKGSIGMAKAIEDAAYDKIIDGIAVVPRGTPGNLRKIRILESTHPLPTEASINAGLKILDLISNVRSGDYVLFLISGGGSALVEVPIRGLSLEDIREVNNLLLRSGATIHEINTVRKHLSMTKGGRLAREVVKRGGKVITLIASDVPGDDPATVASGPTVPDPTTYRDAIAILRNRGLWDKVPGTVRDTLEQGLKGVIEETPKELTNTWNYVIASNMDVLTDLANYAKSLGMESLILTSRMDGEAREVGRYLASIALEARFRGVPIRRGLILSGGEPTVTVVGNGRGGRTTEMCTGFALSVRGVDGVSMISIATDGIDGNIDAAGCVADGHLIEEAMKLGIDPIGELRNNNTAIIFEKTNTIIRTGWTGSNLNIVTVIFVSGY
ncbi:glycerate kinase type-2 family protein [Vulcanisaeta distributa]|uniref:Hydroxypyruvate reductase n=1 Tax=Vulcanisaeta distributa (strain DSM 14429 / JCM 11212 / NBRC 100878 / IC-017) TaxID=572478 RepID=E1QUQ8_VULDI|nr:glycerate kinase [Vulcanisaeta distributa]ADN51177.1 Hydroxypyruvate reductase [Vulcanisaeta distributa DSM 14429]